MTRRSKETALIFSKAFFLSEVGRPLPPGTYRVVVETYPACPSSPSDESRRCCMFRRCLRPAVQVRCFSSIQANSPLSSKPIKARHEAHWRARNLGHAISRSNFGQRQSEDRRRDGRPSLL